MSDASPDTRSATGPRSTPSVLAALADRRTLVMLALGFSAGLPFLLVFDTLSAWLRAAGLSLEVIGFFGLVTMIYSFKFLWAPIVDRASVPLLTEWLGHRRSWMLVCQAFIMTGLWLIAGTDPARELWPVAGCAVLVGLASATQDIAIDAWRIEVAQASTQGVLAAAYAWGYRGAMLIAGFAPLVLAQSHGWRMSYATMAGLMLVGVVAVLAAPPEPPRVRATHDAETGAEQLSARSPARAALLEWLEWGVRLLVLLSGALVLGSGLTGQAAVAARVLTAVGATELSRRMLAVWTSSAAVWVHLLAVLAGFGILVLSAVPVPGVRTRPGTHLAAALGDPLRDFITRHGKASLLIIALVCLYRIPDFVLNIMNPFYLDLGFTLVQIAEVRKIFGLVMTLVGVAAGGAAVARLGMKWAMVIGAFAGLASNLAFVWLAMRGHDMPALVAAIGVENVANGFGGTCLIAYMSGLTSAKFTATQYALLSSLYGIPGRILASQSGRLVESAAKAADAGGLLAPLTGLFAGLPPESFTAAARSGVSPAALGAGYATFFIYSALIGLPAVALALAVFRSPER